MFQHIPKIQDVSELQAAMPAGEPATPEEVSQRLSPLGLKSTAFRHWLELNDARWPWRVVSVHRGSCDVMGAAERGYCNQSASVLSGQQPVVGDWVLLRVGAEGPALDVVLPRQTWLRRSATGGSSSAQFIASNVDSVFVVAGCGATDKLNERGLNPRRLERLIWVVREGGAHPIVLLNKADLIADPAAAASTLSRRLGGVMVCASSAQSGAGLEALNAQLQPGDTTALIGPSGVGKSTLINRLLGEERQRTGEARDLDSKGRHTTTRRELMLTPSGVLLIDTPGMREVALFSEHGEAQGFDDIDELAERCRFHDCAHGNEPGCAVHVAIARGELPAERLESYAALKRDARRQAARHDAHARHLLNKELRARFSGKLPVKG